MKASHDDLEGLLQLQQIDLEIFKLNNQLSNLEQRVVIYETRQKRKEIQKKREQVNSLKEDAKKRLKSILDEDSSLIKKEEDVQAAMDNAQGDYRNVEARTKELAGFEKRRSVLAESRDKVEAELAQVNEVEKTIDAYDKDLKEKEAEAVDSFQSIGGELKQSIAILEEQRKQVTQTIDNDILELYDKTLDRLGGVAVTTLKDNQCGACRATIEKGRLIDLRSQAPLGICPACRRLLIIQ